MFILILAFAAATFAVYAFIPNRGIGGYLASAVIVSGFLGLVHLTKFVILA